MIDLFLGAILIAIAACLGWLTLRSMGGIRFATHRLHLTYPIGAGLLSFGLFAMSWAGLAITLPSVSAIALGILLVLVILPCQRLIGGVRSGRVHSQDDIVGDGTLERALIVAAIALLALMTVVLSIGRSYSSWDAMAIWSIKGYGIAREGTILAARDWGSHKLAYPMNIPLQISAFRLLTGDWLPHSKLIFPLYYLALMVELYRFLRRQTSQLHAGLSTLLIAGSPIVFDHATRGYANLPFSAYLVSGFLALLEGGTSGNRPLELTGSLLIGLATWTRPEGLYLAGFAGAALWLSFRISPAGNPSAVTWTMPALILVLPWQAFTVLGGYQKSVAIPVLAGLRSWLALEFHIADAYRIIRYFVWQALQIKFWGVIVPAFALLLLIKAQRIRFNARASQLFLPATAAAVILATAGYYYFAGFQGDLNYLLSTSAERVLMPGMILGLAGLSVLMEPACERMVGR